MLLDDFSPANRVDLPSALPQQGFHRFEITGLGPFDQGLIRALGERWKARRVLDQPLIERAKAGDFEAMEALLRKYRAAGLRGWPANYRPAA